MNYKIAVASKDGIYVNAAFREALKFYIFEVDEQQNIALSETRDWTVEVQEKAYPEKVCLEKTNSRSDCGAGDEQNNSGKAGQGSHAGTGGGQSCRAGMGGGCENAGGDIPKLELVSDCRCFICSKIGFKAVKFLERKAIVTFELEGEILPAIKKIAAYFERVDHHQSLRGLAKENLTD